MSNASPTSVVSSPKRRRWPRRLLVVLLIFVGLPAAYYFIATWSLERDILQALDETDALDPRWRFEDMQKDRASHRDDENSALQVINVVRITGRNARSFGNHKDYGAVFDKLTSPAQLNLQQVELIREGFEKAPGALIEARKLQDMPNGRFALTPAGDGLTYLLPDQQDVRLVCDLLKHDALLRAQQGDLDGALASCMALLNAARALGDEPFVVSIFIRAVGHRMLVDTLERTLAQGYPAVAPMKELQTRLRRERNDLHAHWIAAMRGDRALFHQFFEALRHRKIRLSEYMQNSWHMRVTLKDRFTDYLPALVTKNYPGHLRHRNKLVAAAQLPLHKQFDEFTALAKKVDRGEQGRAAALEFVSLLPPDLVRSCSVYLQAQAILAATEAGLACERFRHKHKHWPESLAQLVKSGMLEAIPTDPYDGQPLRFVRLKNGIAVYSVGRDKQDNGGQIGRGRLDEWGADPDFQLWDPKHRRQPPRPPVAIDGMVQ